MKQNSDRLCGARQFAAGGIRRAKTLGFAVQPHCRTGARSALLHVVGEDLDGRMARDQVVPFGRSLGLDLSGAVQWPDAHGPELPGARR